MAESTQVSALLTADHKRRKVEAEAGHVKTERVRVGVADKAKANYVCLSNVTRESTWS